MALNFPNPALQTPLNEFSPDSTPAKSTNGVTYVWTNNEKWVASSVVFNDIYVNVTGDNMTGDLTLGPTGTNKITLNAENGDITANGAFLDKEVMWYSSNANTDDKYYMYVGSDGDNYAELVIQLADDATRNPLTIYKGKSSEVANQIVNIQADGSIIAAGQGIFGTSKIIDQSCIVVQSNIADRTVDIKKDGSAMFAGDVKIGGTMPSAPNITLKPDGSATFASGVTEVGSGGSITYAAGRGNLQTNGDIVLANDGITASPKVNIKADGSSKFLGTMQVQNPTVFQGLNAAGSITLEVFDSGTIYNGGTYVNFFPAEPTAGSTAVYAAQANDGSNRIIMRQDGTSLFAGTMSIGPNFDGVTIAAGTDDGLKAAKLNVRGRPNSLADEAFTIDQYPSEGDVFNRAFEVTYAGNVTTAGTINGTVVGASDARFKENITPAKPQLADVVALGGLLKNYDWNDDAPLNEELRSVRQLGLIAQEVAEVCPSLVKDINRTKTMEITPAVIGPKGKVIKEAVTSEVDDSYKGLSQEALIMKLIGAVSEQNALIQSLEAEVTALKGTSTADS